MPDSGFGMMGEDGLSPNSTTADLDAPGFRPLLFVISKLSGGSWR
jgi:hypothetical protein